MLSQVHLCAHFFPVVLFSFSYHRGVHVPSPNFGTPELQTDWREALTSGDVVQHCTNGASDTGQLTMGRTMVFSNTLSLSKEPVQTFSRGLETPGTLSSLLRSIPQCRPTESPWHTCHASQSGGVEQVVVAGCRWASRQWAQVLQVAILLRDLGQEAILQN